MIKCYLRLVMAALWNRAGHYIFALWFLLYLLLSFYLFSSPNLSRRRLDICHFSANLRRRSETCCSRLAENKGRKIAPKSRHLGTIAQIYRAISSQITHDQHSEKNVLNSNISSICAHNMVNFGPLAAEIFSLVWGTPTNFNGFRVLPALLRDIYTLCLRKSSHL